MTYKNYKIMLLVLSIGSFYSSSVVARLRIANAIDVAKAIAPMAEAQNQSMVTSQKVQNQSMVPSKLASFYNVTVPTTLKLEYPISDVQLVLPTNKNIQSLNFKFPVSNTTASLRRSCPVEAVKAIESIVQQGHIALVLYDVAPNGKTVYFSIFDKHNNQKVASMAFAISNSAANLKAVDVLYQSTIMQRMQVSKVSSGQMFSIVPGAPVTASTVPQGMISIATPSILQFAVVNLGASNGAQAVTTLGDNLAEVKTFAAQINNSNSMKVSVNEQNQQLIVSNAQGTKSVSQKMASVGGPYLVVVVDGTKYVSVARLDAGQTVTINLMSKADQQKILARTERSVITLPTNQLGEIQVFSVRDVDGIQLCPPIADEAYMPLFNGVKLLPLNKQLYGQVETMPDQYILGFYASQKALLSKATISTMDLGSELADSYIVVMTDQYKMYHFAVLNMSDLLVIKVA